MKDSGDYKNFIEIQAETTTDQTNESFSQNWSTVVSAYAAIEPLSGKDVSMMGGFESVYNYRIRFRAIAVEIKKDMRVKWVDGFTGKTLYFNILHVRNVEQQNREIQLNCEVRSYEQ